MQQPCKKRRKRNSKCYLCRSTYSLSHNCPAKEKICTKCKKHNHLARVCKSNKAVNAVVEDEYIQAACSIEDDDIFLYAIENKNNNDEALVTLKVKNVMSTTFKIDMIFKQVKELSDKIQLAVEVPRITQRQVYQNNPPHTMPEEYYQCVVFIPMVNSVISDLKSLFPRDMLNSFQLTVLLPSNIVNCTDDLLQPSVKEISSIYIQPLGLTMPSTRATLILAEVHMWRSRWL
ncbi:hypothetical protein QYM36_010714 [Artemia franciscana]|uniref:Uncharacterized protein n=1 Tax=Artemia franciscana TaxID=6661 RepID=A0AA88HUU0_ARTSF|nr:hypothetical protein QYM36_010714 [Artemia franciscana]